ncbi:MAG: hypothetical protein D6719_02505 [Candidatus Dadabacteria bacterium]|nr:MAG: hypothetical protein D6719_02505 [Candidatus Dadabacteria bacterium]
MTKKHKKKNPDRSVAVQYTAINELPIVLASGSGELARTIRLIASRHGIPITEDTTLAELLSELNAGDPISPECYSLMAEVLTFLYFTDKSWQEKHSFLGDVFNTQPE